MSIARIESNDPNKLFYNLKDKLSLHVMERSKKAFKEAKIKRNLITSKEELVNYTNTMRKFFVDSIGGIPYDNNLPLNAKITGVVEEPGLRIEKVIFESRPNVYVTANLYIPEKRKNPCGAVLFQLGHAEEGKSSRQYQRVARAIASVGLIVMVMDHIGQGERFSYYEEKFNSWMIPPTIGEHQYAGEQCVLIGDNISRYFISDAMRAIDYLISRPEVDNERIGVTGSSGGGTMTSYMMVCDPRIKAAAPGTFITNREAYFHSGNAQDSEQIWYSATEFGFDHYELLACFAPKPVLLLCVDSDFFPIEGTEEVLTINKKFWELYGKEDDISMCVDGSLHKYTDNLAIAAAEFFYNSFYRKKKKADSSVLKSIDENQLQCTSTGQVKLEYKNSKFVFDENLERFNLLTKPEISFEKFLMEKIEYQRITSPVRLRTFEEMFVNGLKVVPHMWFSQPNMPNFGLMFSGLEGEENDIVLCLWNNGTDDIESHIYKIREIVKNGKQAFVIDLSGIGKCAPNPLNTEYNDKSQYGVIDKITKDLFFLGDSLCALRLFELRYAVNLIRNHFGKSVSIYSEGIASNYAQLYKVIDKKIPIDVQSEIPNLKEIVTEKYYENYNISSVIIPGIVSYMKY